MPDIAYPRPNGRRKYLSIAKHQSTSQNRFSKWVNIATERDLFDFADYGNYHKTPDVDLSWACTDGNLWSIKQDRSSVGTNNQQFGFFPQPVNTSDSWHGYPIIPFSNSRYSISDDLLERWVLDGVINVDEIPNIYKRKRL